MSDDRALAIKTVCFKFSFDDDDLWVDNLPAVSAVKARTGFTGLSREEIDEATDGLVRPERPVKPEAVVDIEHAASEAVVDIEHAADEGATDLRNTWPPETVSVAVERSADELDADLQVARNAAVEADARVREARVTVRSARAELSSQISQWVNGVGLGTQEQRTLANVRAFSASQQELRRKIVEGGYAPPSTVPGPSMIDRVAMRPGGIGRRGDGRDFRRGGLPASMKGARVKLPSDL